MALINHSQGTDNALEDLSFDDTKELSAKAALALNGLIDKRSVSQTEAAAITGMTQPKISQVHRTNFRTFRWRG